MSMSFDEFWNLSANLRDTLRHELLQNWSSEQTSNLPSQEAAYEFAVALGRCEMMGLQPDDSELQSIAMVWSMADAALQNCNRFCVEFSAKLHGIEERLLRCETELEKFDVANSILESRFELQAARLSIGDAEIEGIALEKKAPELFSARLLWLDEQLSRLDTQIDDCGPFLCIAAQTYFSENLTAALLEEIWQPRPWWLTEEINDRYLQFKELDDSFALGIANAYMELIPTTFESSSGETVSSDHFFEAYSKEPELSAAMDAHVSNSIWLRKAVFLFSSEDFDIRVLFKMSADDHKNSKNRMAYQGTEKFRFSLDVDWKSNSVETPSWGNTGRFRLRWGNWVGDVDLKKGFVDVESKRIMLVLQDPRLTCPSLFVRILNV